MLTVGSTTGLFFSTGDALRQAICGRILVLELEVAAWGERKRGNGMALQANGPSGPIGRLVHYLLLSRYWHTFVGRAWK
jgi:hypothetical protein